jgi:hypothetical protein
MLAWILIAALGSTATITAGLAIAWRRASRRAQSGTELATSARTELRRVVEEETAEHTAEIRRVLARERAEAASLIAAEERRLHAERRAEYDERERILGERLVESLTGVERRLEDRVRGFVDDLERAQRHLETQLHALEHRHKEVIANVEARIEADSAELGSTADEQRRVIHRLRDELERAATQAVTEALDELESHTADRRRSVEEITERLRARETAIAESIEKAETDVRARLDVMLVEWERRQNERLKRVTEREIERHVQVATLAFDERLREIREDSATHLRRELDRAVETLARVELVERIQASAPGNARS